MAFLRPATALLALALGCGGALAQAPQGPAAPAYPNAAPPVAAAPPTDGVAPMLLEWTPPALAQLSAQALAKSSFTLDRTMLSAAAGLMSDSDPDARAAIQKLDGLSVHLLRFSDAAPADPALIDEIRDTYHLHGWKHAVSTGRGGALHNSTTDVWIIMDGVNLRGAVVLVESPKSLTLATVAGNLSPVDLLHLRGHFGIPRFDSDGLGGGQIQ